jgi:hypothetical protein
MRSTRCLVAAAGVTALLALAGCNSSSPAGAPSSQTVPTTAVPAVTAPAPTVAAAPATTTPATALAASNASINAKVQALTNSLNQMDSDLASADEAVANGG